MFSHIQTAALQRWQNEYSTKTNHCWHLVSSICSAIGSAPGVKYETFRVKCRRTVLLFLARRKPRSTEITPSNAKQWPRLGPPPYWNNGTLTKINSKAEAVGAGTTSWMQIYIVLSLTEQTPSGKNDIRGPSKPTPNDLTNSTSSSRPTPAVKQQQLQDLNKIKKKSWQDRQCDVLFQPLFTTQLTSARSIPHSQFLYIQHAKSRCLTR